MIHCKYCGVELEIEMKNCPLCGMPTDEKEAGNISSPFKENKVARESMSRPRKRFVWEVISITILSFIITTLLINLILSEKITWSEYPIAACFIIFSYISSFAFLNQSKITKTIAGFIASSLFLIMIDALSGGIEWSIKLGIPILLSGNLITGLLLWVTDLSKRKSINIIAYTFISAAVYCLFIEGTISYFKTSAINLQWSIIVIVCVVPVSMVMLYIHQKLSKSGRIKRTFHI